MDAVVGLAVLVAIVWIVRAAMSGSRSAPPQAGQGPDRTPSPRPRATPAVDPDERRRRDRADGAFVDGILFAHHFDPLGRHDAADDDDGSASYGDDDVDGGGWDDGSDDWDDGWNDGWDEDDVFHDDAGDW